MNTNPERLWAYLKWDDEEAFEEGDGEGRTVMAAVTEEEARCLHECGPFAEHDPLPQEYVLASVADTEKEAAVTLALSVGGDSARHFEKMLNERVELIRDLTSERDFLQGKAHETAALRRERDALATALADAKAKMEAAASYWDAQSEKMSRQDAAWADMHVGQAKGLREAAKIVAAAAKGVG